MSKEIDREIQEMTESLHHSQVQVIMSERRAVTEGSIVQSPPARVAAEVQNEVLPG